MSGQKNNTGNVKKQLIDNGLLLLNKVGYEDFSIRKVAAMCGVSHAAPYKHFTNKEELITAIGMAVDKAFKTSLEETALKHSDHPKTQLVELGKKYVQFMVENPEFLKFLFLTPRKNGIKFKDNHFTYNENGTFSVFKNTASTYLKSVGKDPDAYTTDILTMWSVVHGIAILLAEQSLSIDGDYLNVVSDILYHLIKN